VEIEELQMRFELSEEEFIRLDCSINETQVNNSKLRQVGLLFVLGILSILSWYIKQEMFAVTILGIGIFILFIANKKSNIVARNFFNSNSLIGIETIVEVNKDFINIIVGRNKLLLATENISNIFFSTIAVQVYHESGANIVIPLDKLSKLEEEVLRNLKGK